VNPCLFEEGKQRGNLGGSLFFNSSCVGNERFDLAITTIPLMFFGKPSNDESLPVNDGSLPLVKQQKSKS